MKRDECSAYIFRALKEWLVALCLLMAASILFVLVASSADIEKSYAQTDSSRPSLLVIDSALGDFEQDKLHWVGSDARIVSESGGLVLLSSDSPTWWKASDDKSLPPATFVLGGSGSAHVISSENVAWALDQIWSSGAEPRTFVLAIGESGFAVREYAEDLSNRKQSSRADIVGVGFCGTPHSGYSMISKYPEQGMWDTLAQSANLTRDDLTPGSPFLSRLDGGKLPSASKNLLVNGMVGDLGFGLTDGAGTLNDFALNESVSDQVVVSHEPATISHNMNLTMLWRPFTSAIDYPGRSVDMSLVDRLSGMSSYGSSPEVQADVQDFYESWFGEGTPVTHDSIVMLLDLSGSMLEGIGSGENKLSASKDAAKQYLSAVQSYSGLAQSPPVDVTVFGFGESTGRIASGYDQSAINMLESMSASGETNIGLALESAVSTLNSSPRCASKHILLLSDGESTRGQSDSAMLSGVVAQAASSGIVIDAVGFGNIGESDSAFLEQVTSQTGGTLYKADDTYSLKTNFLKSYYSTLGLSVLDEEVNLGSSEKISLGNINNDVVAIQMGIVCQSDAPQVEITRDGSPVEASQYTVSQENGLLSVQYANPMPGEYALTLKGGSGSARVFVVNQRGISRTKGMVGEQLDTSMIMLVGAAILMVIALVVTCIVTMRRGKGSGPRSQYGNGRGW